MRKIRNKKEKGITLIALVVTIVVLIILATVSINAVIGQNGIIGKAKQARESYEKSVKAEDAAMQELLNEIEDYATLPYGWDKNKIQAIKSEDNIIVPVPKGYIASTVDGEKSVSSGFVIKEGDNGGATEEINEFVWVPVSNISDIYDEENNAGQLWDFSGTTSTKFKYFENDYREPDVVTFDDVGGDSTTGSEFDAVSTNLQQAGLSSTATARDFKTQLQNEFDEMINSVKTYGGFYIGRYETGDLSQTKAVVQKNNSDIGGQTWYTQYRLCKTIKANENVTTSMIWGCQWDATLRWMQTNTNSEVANFPEKSEGKGNYAGTQGDTDKVIPAGSNDAYAVNNIYDMAGNVWDWTLEVFEWLRIERGGYYGTTASRSPTVDRSENVPDDSGLMNGCRAILYIN